LSGSTSYGVVHAVDSSYHETHSIAENNHSATGTTSPTILLGGKREQLQSLLASGRGLDVTGICRVHETQLNPVQYAQSGLSIIGGAVGTCERCKRTQTQLWCVYCNEPIDALYPPCLNCGCAIHEYCLTEWHSAGETECPAGDECDCVHEADHGQVESWVAMKAVLAREQQQQQHQHAKRSPETASLHGKTSNGLGRVAGLAGRLRTRSIPAGLHLKNPGDEDGDGQEEDGTPGSRSSVSTYGGADDVEHLDKEDWESVVSVPAGSASAVQGKPSPLGPGAVSAARLSLGNRLKKSLAEGGRPVAAGRRPGPGSGRKSGT
jgi:hypothetical protein